MHKINQLETQNMLDGWSSLYANISSSLFNHFGQRSEEIIRETIRRFGDDLGKSKKKEFLRSEIPVNLKTIYPCKSLIHTDPRFQTIVEKSSEEVLLFDVISCPIAHLWDKMGKIQLGRYFCEEYYHSFYKSFTYECGQVNLSKILINKTDCQCQFAIYFRQANLEDEKIDYCFPKNLKEDMKEVQDKAYRLCDNKKYSELSIKLFYYFLQVSYEKHGEEGKSMVAKGLRKELVDALEFIKRRGFMTNNVFDINYFSNNYPLNINTLDSPLWNDYDGFNAKEIFKINFNDILLDTFHNNLDINVKMGG